MIESSIFRLSKAEQDDLLQEILMDYDFNGQNYHWYTLDRQIQHQRIDMLVVDGPPAILMIVPVHMIARKGRLV